MSPVQPTDPAVAEVSARRVRDGIDVAELDRLAVEAPLELRIDGRAFTVLMRTPGADEELALGFLFGEGIIASRRDVARIGRPPDLLADDCANFLDLSFAEGRVSPPIGRTFYASASCGVCGKTSIADLVVRAPVIESPLQVAQTLLAELPDRLRAAQPAFAATGGLHGAALFDAGGALLAAREDVGRHNAVDKLVGWALASGRLPLSEAILFVSGRAGFEILQKAIVAGIPVVGAVGAASTLAVALAERFGVALATFVRPGSLNLFGNLRRVRAAC
ncbi:MAG: formate dehydrogenase accessory sulfurtransferase FdhD [Thermoanaerobaculia bacterium]